MKFYFVTGETPEGVPYCSTLANAKQLARETAKTETMDVQVHHVEVATHRDAILNLLNVGPGAHVDLGVVFTAKARG